MFSYFYNDMKKAHESSEIHGPFSMKFIYETFYLGIIGVLKAFSTTVVAPVA